MPNIKATDLPLSQKRYIGKILPDLDPKRQGRYKVHIPELMVHIPESSGIWCKNRFNNMTGSINGEYGTYVPLHPDTVVLIEFVQDNFASGRIVDIVGDWFVDSLGKGQDANEPIIDLNDRDNVYRLVKTPKKWNSIYINEETEKEPNTIYLIYNRDNNPKRRTVLRIDESGVHWFTRDNKRIRIMGSENRQIDQNQTEYIKGYRTIHVLGEDDLKVHNNQRKEIDLDEETFIHENRKITIDLDEHKHIKQHQYMLNDGNIHQIVEGYIRKLLKGDVDIRIQGNLKLHVDGKVELSCDNTIDTYSSGDIKFESDSNILHHNTGLSSFTPQEPDEIEDAEPAKPFTMVRDLGPQETSEYDETEEVIEERDKVVGDKCDDATDSYNVGPIYREI